MQLFREYAPHRLIFTGEELRSAGEGPYVGIIGQHEHTQTANSPISVEKVSYSMIRQVGDVCHILSAFGVKVPQGIFKHPSRRQMVRQRRKKMTPKYL